MRVGGSVGEPTVTVIGGVGIGVKVGGRVLLGRGVKVTMGVPVVGGAVAVEVGVNDP